eukprot:TRINITY_DN18246_c1_g1_i5.p1 TRINITY_DN18246_c1_g1~~TRINITY_DN18246_c1_g1_i5.p1  ORF type:complete len:264 (-),score=13.79 TRINITY_DN18246_c1_g1_i5:219-1010(-)
MPLVGNSLYVLNCLWAGKEASHRHDEDQTSVEGAREQDSFLAVVACLGIFVLCVCWLTLNAGFERRLSLMRASLRWPFSFRRTENVLPVEIQQRSLPAATVVGLQGERHHVNNFVGVLAAHNEEANGNTDSELHSLSSDGSASSMESDDVPLPTRGAAKEALLALYVLSRSAWGPDGRSLPLHLYTGVAECLGRQHFERHWREERDRMRELTRTLYHAEFEALLAAIERGGDEARDEVASTKSYASSVGSLTRIWKHLFRWFR